MSDQDTGHVANVKDQPKSVLSEEHIVTTVEGERPPVILPSLQSITDMSNCIISPLHLCKHKYSIIN